jgi:hypothetical protein
VNLTCITHIVTRHEKKTLSQIGNPLETKGGTLSSCGLSDLWAIGSAGVIHALAYEAPRHVHYRLPFDTRSKAQRDSRAYSPSVYRSPYINTFSTCKGPAFNGLLRGLPKVYVCVRRAAAWKLFTDFTNKTNDRWFQPNTCGEKEMLKVFSGFMIRVNCARPKAFIVVYSCIINHKSLIGWNHIELRTCQI